MEKAVEVLKILKKEYPNAKYYLNFKTPLDLMVAAILSAQVRDEVVNASTPAMFSKYKKAEDYAKASVSDLLKYISKITFAGNYRYSRRYIHRSQSPEAAEHALVPNRQGADGLRPAIRHYRVYRAQFHGQTDFHQSGLCHVFYQPRLHSYDN